MSLQIIGGKFRSHPLKAPKHARTRPTTSLVRAAVFNICQGLVEGAKFLDLFAGSGAMGFEALSRGAAFVTLVEMDREALKCIGENAQRLGVAPQIEVLGMPVTRALAKIAGSYDLIYIDPPYEMEVGEVLRTIVEKKLLAPEGILFLEEQFEARRTAPACAGLSLVESRRYGIAGLHQYAR